MTYLVMFLVTFLVTFGVSLLTAKSYSTMMLIVMFTWATICGLLWPITTLLYTFWLFKRGIATIIKIFKEGARNG